MAYFCIHGQKPLEGEIAVTGAKNAVLKFIAAALVCDGPVIMSNVPDIDDVRRMVSLVADLGVTVRHDPMQHMLTVDASTLHSHTIKPEHARALRTSIMLVGPLLIRRGAARMGYPGGCVIGRRPIDLYLMGYEKFSAHISEEGETFEFSTSQVHGMTYIFPFVSHVATETFMITAARAQGRTILKNAAQEPEVAALADFLNACGAHISGAGTSTIVIDGVDHLTGGSVTIVPDRVEAGTFIILGALMRSRVRVLQCIPEHLENLLVHLAATGVPFEIGDTWIETKPYDHELTSVNIKTHEYPGFVTDLQAPFTVLLTQARGISLVHETIFEGRLFYTDLLNRMGADIILCDPHRAIVHGATPLRGRKLESPDIRAGIAMVLAGLIASGETTIGTIEQIDRGYEQIDARLRTLGADMIRVS